MYLIYPYGPSVPVPVFCDMTTEGGKWTVSRQGGLRPDGVQAANSAKWASHLYGGWIQGC